MTPSVARVGVGLVGLALAGGLAGCGIGGNNGVKTGTAYFKNTIGLYTHNDVRILGIRVGEVTGIKPMGDKVRVDFQYDDKYKVPADAKAVVIAPSIVSDRYVQLAPVYETGPTLANHATIPLDRTAVPVELDDIYAALNTLNKALGPNGANKKGALSDLLHVGAQNLQGNGQALGETINNLSRAVQTLSDQRGDLFATVKNLQDFTTTLARNDGTVRQFNQSLADVAAQLDGQRAELATAVKQLGVALGDVATFVRDNKAALTENVSDLAKVTKVLVTQKKGLEEFLDTAPTALSNLQLAYNPLSGTLDTRDNNNGQATPQQELCNILIATGQPQSLCAQLNGIFSQLPSGVSGGGKASSGSATARAPKAPATVPSAPAAGTPDLTLGGILEAGR